MSIEDIRQQFIKNCKDYAKSLNALSFEQREEKHICICSMYFSIIKLEFVMALKESIYHPPCTLFCRVYLNKNSRVYLDLSELFAYADIEEYKAFCFSYIESIQRLDLCFGSLTDVLNRYIPIFEQLVLENKSDEIYQKHYEYIAKRFSLSPKDIDFSKVDNENSFEYNYFSSLQDLHENYTLLLFTNDKAYFAFLSKDKEKAIKLYAKKVTTNKAHPYEKMLYEFIISDRYDNFSPISEECFSLKLAKTELSPKGKALNSIRNYIISLFICSVPLCAFMLVINCIFSVNTLCFVGVPCVFGILFAIVPAMFGLLFFGEKINRIFSKSHSEYSKNLQKIILPKSNVVLMKTVFALSFVVCLGVALFICADNIRFYEDKFVMLDEEELKYNEYYYKDITDVYYISARYNVYGDRINRDSYVISFNDGTYIDLDGYTTAKISKEEILPILDKTPISLDSDRDLP